MSYCSLENDAITEPMVEKIVAQTHELQADYAIRTLQQCNRIKKGCAPSRQPRGSEKCGSCLLLIVTVYS